MHEVDVIDLVLHSIANLGNTRVYLLLFLFYDICDVLHCSVHSPIFRVDALYDSTQFVIHFIFEVLNRSLAKLLVRLNYALHNIKRAISLLLVLENLFLDKVHDLINGVFLCLFLFAKPLLKVYELLSHRDKTVAYVAVSVENDLNGISYWRRYVDPVLRSDTVELLEFFFNPLEYILVLGPRVYSHRKTLASD